MKKIALLLCLSTLACNQQNTTDNQGSSETVNYVVTNDTIPKIRKSVQKAPVSHFTQPVPDSLNDWQFSISVFETPQTFRYVLKMKYKEFQTTDTISIPDFGINPTVEVRKGDKDFEAIVGFLDKERVFKPYKKVEAAGNQLKIKTIQQYRRGVVLKK